MTSVEEFRDTPTDFSRQREPDLARPVIATSHKVRYPQPMVDPEPIRIVPDHDPDPLRGILIAIPISAALWVALGGGIWFVLRLVS